MIVVLSLLSLIVAAVLAVDVQRRLHTAQRQQRRNEAAVAEAQLVADIRKQISAGQTIAENVVAGGTSTVRAVHKGIASIPFNILESIPVTRDTTRVVRRIHDAVSDLVYGGITTTNKTLHQVARDAVNREIKPDADALAGKSPKDS